MAEIKSLWYTRCPVPTPLGIAAQLGWIEEEFRPDGIAVRTLQDETDRELRDSHFDHRLPHSFRQGGNIPAIWARSTGRDTRVVGLTWTDEAQVLLTSPKSGIRDVLDLKGKRLGVATRPNDLIDFWKATTIRAYVAALHLHGLSERDVELVELPRQDVSSAGWPSEPLARSVEAQALARGDVDVIFHKGSRGVELADAVGAHTVFDVGAHPDPLVRVNNGSPRTLTVDGALLRDHFPVVVRILKRVIAAGRWAEAHPAESVAYVARETRSAEAAVRRAYSQDVHRNLRTSLDEASLDALANFTHFLASWKFIPRDFDVHAWIDPRPLRQALRELASEEASAEPAAPTLEPAAPQRRAEAAASLNAAEGR